MGGATIRRGWQEMPLDGVSKTIPRHMQLVLPGQDQASRLRPYDRFVAIIASFHDRVSKRMEMLPPASLDPTSIDHAGTRA